MERNERTRLKAMHRQLQNAVATIDTLLETTTPPRRMTKREARKRAVAICEDLRHIRVVGDGLRRLTKEHGFPHHAVGALFAAGYLKKTTKGTVLGPRGRRIIKRR